MKNDLEVALEQLLLTEWLRISTLHATFSRRDVMWYEFLLRHDSIDIDPQAERPGIERENYCYLESPSWEGNVVRMPRETALKILALGFIDSGNLD